MMKLSSIIGLYGDIKIKKSSVLEMKYNEDDLVSQMIHITQNLYFDRMAKVYDEGLKVIISHNSDHILINDEMQDRIIRLFKNNEDYIVDLTNMIFYYITDTDNTEEVCQDIGVLSMEYGTKILEDYYNSVKTYLPSDYELGEILEIILK